MSHNKRTNLSLTLPEIYNCNATQCAESTPTPTKCLGNLLKSLEELPGIDDLKHLSPVKSFNSDSILNKDDTNPFAITFTKAAQSKNNLNINEISNNFNNQESLNTPSIEMYSLVEGNDGLSTNASVNKLNDDFNGNDASTLSSPYDIIINSNSSNNNQGKLKCFFLIKFFIYIFFFCCFFKLFLRKLIFNKN